MVDPERKWGLAKDAARCSHATLRAELVKFGAKIASHGRYVTFQMANVAVPRAMFRTILRLIDDLRRRPAPA